MEKGIPRQTCFPSKKALRRNRSMIRTTPLPTSLTGGLAVNVPVSLNLLEISHSRASKGDPCQAMFPCLRSRLGTLEAGKTLPSSAGPAKMFSPTPLTLTFTLPANHFSLASLLFSMSFVLGCCRVRAVYMQKPSKQQGARHECVNHSPLCIKSPGLAARNLGLSHWLWH